MNAARTTGALPAAAAGWMARQSHFPRPAGEGKSEAKQTMPSKWPTFVVINVGWIGTNEADN
jgi:hypothetical protein